MHRLRIALISPKGPLYRHRGGIFKRSLRYAPLTLTTLASLVPPELAPRCTLVDEGIADVDPNLDADVVGLTVITGTAPRAYELAARFRRAASRSCLVDRTSRSCPTMRSRMRTAWWSATPRTPGRNCCAIWRAADCGRATIQQPGLSLASRPFPRRDLLPRAAF